MKPKDFEGAAAVAMFLTIMWPLIRRQFQEKPLPPAIDRGFRIFLIPFYILAIVTAVLAIKGADADRTISPGFMVFCIGTFCAMILRHVNKLARRGEVMRIPEHAHVHQVGDMTWIAVPDNPPGPTAMDVALTEFDDKALDQLVDEYASSLGPWHRDFGRWMSKEAPDGRCLFDMIPGKWSDLFWQSAANYILAEGQTAFPDGDDDGNYHRRSHVAGAILVALCALDERIQERVLQGASSDAELIVFLREGLDCYDQYVDPRPVPKIRTLVGSGPG